MKPTIAKEEHGGRPSEPRPDPLRIPPPPWSLDLLVGVNRVRHHALSPDGQQIAFIWDRDNHSDLWLMPTAGGSWPTRLTFHRPACTFWSDSQPRWDFQASMLVYVAEGEIWTVGVEDGTARQLTGYGMAASWPIPSPDGNDVYCVSEQGQYQNLCRIRPQRLEGAWPSALTHLQGDVSDPRPSPSGGLIAFVFHPRDDLERSEICIVPSEGGEVKHFTGAQGVRDRWPRWSPDGGMLGFVSNRSGWDELYQVEAATGEVQSLTSMGATVTEFAWSPDGRQVVYVLNRNGVGALHLLRVADRHTRAFRDVPGWHSRPQWAPDGSWLTVEFESPTSPPEILRLPVQAEVGGGGIERLSFSMSPALQAAGLKTPEFVHYPSTDGCRIPALLFRPGQASSKSPCPAIVYPHGGPTSEWVQGWDLLMQWILAKGYAVLAPNYRGSTGYGLEFQHALHGRWGIVDTADMLAAADYLAGLDWIDSGRLGIFGMSYGSYLAVLALARDPQHRYRCGVAKYGDSDILRSWAQGDRVGREDLERQMGHPAHNRPGYQAGSPIYDVENIQSPLLIVHGDSDARVNPKQSEELVSALRRHDKTFEYIIYEGEGHGLLYPENRRHFYARLERFLDWYLL